MNSATVKRIEDVNLLRSAQFAEDAGPLAHPIRPDSFIEISNFYTLTIYEKGAEVIRMMHRLLGADAFRKGGDLYFERHDGEAATCEDFIVAMEEASGVDLQQFRRWYEQAGTPRIAVSSEWNADAGEYSLTFEQSCPSTPGQADKPDFCIPIDIALLHDNGTDDNEKDIQLEQELLVLTDSRTTIKRSGFNHEPVAALLRGFSAPVNLDYDYSDDQLLYLVRYETDGFVRWDATRRFFVNLIKAHLAGNQLLESELVKQKIAEVGELLVALIESGFESGEGDAWRPSVDAALLAEMLDPPGYTFVEQQVNTVDPIALSTTIDQLRMQYASVIHEQLASFYQRLVAILAESGGYQPTAGDIALRSLKNTCLGLTAIQPTQTELDTINDQYASADNMTDQFAALKVLLASESTDAHKLADDLLDQFYGQWQGESLVVNQWLGARVSANLPSSLARLKALQQHGAYDETNPNKVRALIGGFCANSPAAFHAHSGEGYGLLAQEVLRLDSANPQLAARLLTPLTRWQRFTEPNRGLMRAELQRIADSGQLSSDVFEVVSKSLAR